MARNYELVLMLDPETEDGARDKLTADTRERIEKGGSVEQADSWGVRKLAYEIRQRNEADYRYFRFTAGNDVLDDLDHSLKITDGVLRFRVFKVDPETPTNPPPASERPASVGSDRPDRRDRGDRDDRGGRGERG